MRLDAYLTDGKAGFIVPQANGNKKRNPDFVRYFFYISPRQIEEVKHYPEQYFIVVCKGMCLMFFTLESFEPYLRYVSPFREEGTGKIMHWDPEFHFYEDGHIELQLGKGKKVDVTANAIQWKTSPYLVPWHLLKKD